MHYKYSRGFAHGLAQSQDYFAAVGTLLLLCAWPPPPSGAGDHEKNL